MNSKTKIEDHKNANTREDFCGACIGGGIAIGSGALAGYTGTVKKGWFKKHKLILLIVSIIISVISLIITIYYLRTCSSCR
jgi:uncharacterized membrane protein YvbJ